MSEQQEANKKRLGELIQDGYKAAGYSRESVAPEVGISSRTLFSIENGLSIPRALTQRKIEEVLGWRKGAIAYVLGLGPDTDVSKVPLPFMQESKNSAWADIPEESGADVIHRLTAAATDAAVMLREKDRRISELERQVALLQGGFDLAADSSPNRGKASRDHFGSVEQENQDTA